MPKSKSMKKILKMKASSSIRIIGEFTPVYSKISTISSKSLYKMVNIKEIQIQLEDATTLAGGSTKKTIIFGQDRLASKIIIAFWNRFISVCDSIDLKKPTYIENVQVKQFKPG